MEEAAVPAIPAEAAAGVPEHVSGAAPVQAIAVVTGHHPPAVPITAPEAATATIEADIIITDLRSGHMVLVLDAEELHQLFLQSF